MFLWILRSCGRADRCLVARERGRRGMMTGNAAGAGSRMLIDMQPRLASDGQDMSCLAVVLLLRRWFMIEVTTRGHDEGAAGRDFSAA